MSVLLLQPGINDKTTGEREILAKLNCTHICVTGVQTKLIAR